MNIAEPLIRIEKRLESLVNDCKKLKKDLNKVNQSLDNLKTATEHKKKYRPFTLNEFLVTFPMLADITMREKGDNDCIVTCTVTAYRTRVMSADICLGVEWFSLKELFDKYEFKDGLGNWQPFGVIDE